MPANLYNLFSFDDEPENSGESGYYTMTINAVSDDPEYCTRTPSLRRIRRNRPEQQTIQEPPKICRTTIEDSTDPYWKNLEQKWKIR